MHVLIFFVLLLFCRLLHTSGFGSWSGCTRGDKKDGETCMGCTLAYQREKEKFPIFNALLNAAHKGIKIRVLTNDFDEVDCEGRISPLPFLALNGVEIVYFNTLTFMHVKYIAVDGVRASVSSVNFSFSSFMLNREAGIIFDGPQAAPIITYFQATFDSDWVQGNAVNSTVIALRFSVEDLKIIQNPLPVPVAIPPPKLNNASYYNPPNNAILAPSFVGLNVSPDYAREDLGLSKTNKTFSLMVYQINEPFLCQVRLSDFFSNPNPMYSC